MLRNVNNHGYYHNLIRKISSQRFNRLKTRVSLIMFSNRKFFVPMLSYELFSEFSKHLWLT